MKTDSSVEAHREQSEDRSTLPTSVVATEEALGQKEALGKSAKAKPVQKRSKSVRKLVALQKLQIDPWFQQYGATLAKISYDLKSAKAIAPHLIISALKAETISVIESGGKYFVVDGIRSWQIAATVCLPTEQIEVLVLPELSETDRRRLLIQQVILRQILYRSSDAGARIIVNLVGEMLGDSSLKPLLAEAFNDRLTKDGLANLLGLRAPGLYENSPSKKLKTATPAEHMENAADE